MSDTDFSARKREAAPVHRRSLEFQRLDALLRIEEKIEALLQTIKEKHERSH
jgi:hypothetical protein